MVKPDENRFPSRSTIRVPSFARAACSEGLLRVAKKKTLGGSPKVMTKSTERVLWRRKRSVECTRRSQVMLGVQALQQILHGACMGLVWQITIAHGWIGFEGRAIGWRIERRCSSAITDVPCHALSRLERFFCTAGRSHWSLFDARGS